MALRCGAVTLFVTGLAMLATAMTLRCRAVAAP